MTQRGHKQLKRRTSGMSVDRSTEPYDVGWRDKRDGKSLDANPYLIGSEGRLQWYWGYLEYTEHKIGWR